MRNIQQETSKSRNLQCVPVQNNELNSSTGSVESKTDHITNCNSHHRQILNIANGREFKRENEKVCPSVTDVRFCKDETGQPATQLADEFGVTKAAVSKIKKDKENIIHIL